MKQPKVDINGPLLPAPAPEIENSRAYYGPLKAECDRIVQAIFGDEATIVRPTYIIGPGDTMDRFTYWVERFHRGEDIVCPAGPELNCVWIDVRDLCHLLVTLAENDRGASGRPDFPLDGGLGARHSRVLDDADAGEACQREALADGGAGASRARTLINASNPHSDRTLRWTYSTAQC